MEIRKVVEVHFSDPDTGGFSEILGEDGRPYGFIKFGIVNGNKCLLESKG